MNCTQMNSSPQIFQNLFRITCSRCKGTWWTWKGWKAHLSGPYYSGEEGWEK